MVASKNPHVPKLTDLTKLGFTFDLIKQNLWCQYVRDVISQPINNTDEQELDHVSLAAYHSNQINDTRRTSVSVLLPLFPNDSKSVAMIKHSMDFKKCCQYCQPWADTCYSVLPTTL